MACSSNNLVGAETRNTDDDDDDDDDDGTDDDDDDATPTSTHILQFLTWEVKNGFNKK